MEDLISVILKRNIGCQFGDHFTGILVYEVDIVLLAPWHHLNTAVIMVIDIHLCSLYAGEHNFLFSTKSYQLKVKGSA